MGGLARALHLSMQLAGCVIPSFPHDSMQHQWETLRSSLPPTLAVSQAFPEFVTAHPPRSRFCVRFGHGLTVLA